MCGGTQYCCKRTSDVLNESISITAKRDNKLKLKIKTKHEEANKMTIMCNSDLWLIR